MLFTPRTYALCLFAGLTEINKNPLYLNNKINAFAY